MQFKAAALLLALAACGATRRAAYKADVDQVLSTRSPVLPEVTTAGTLEPHPWRVGQWARYGVDGLYETINVVAMDTCGTWIAEEVQTYRTHMTVRYCLVTPPASFDPAHADELVQIMMLTDDDGRTKVIDFRTSDPAKRSYRGSPDFARNIARFLPAAWHGDTSAREAVYVPAAHFAYAIRTTETIGTKSFTRWAHPAVPFDGTVKMAGDGSEFRLLGYGEAGTPPTIPDVVARDAAMRESTRPWLFVGVGATSSWFTSGPGEQASAASGWSYRVGIRPTARLDVLFEDSHAAIAHYTPDPMMTQDLHLVTGGLRYHLVPPKDPYNRGLFSFGVLALDILGDVGYVGLSRSPGTDWTQVATGLVAGAGVGFTFMQSRGLRGSIELTDHAATLAGEGVRQSFATTARIEGDLPTW